VTLDPFEEILDPQQHICDPHHHLWAGRGRPHLLADLLDDTGSGHRVVRTVFVECSTQYLEDGPVPLRPVGEVRFAVGQAEASDPAGGPDV
jgi:hypothetical protein